MDKTLDKIVDLHKCIGEAERSLKILKESRADQKQIVIKYLLENDKKSVTWKSNILSLSQRSTAVTFKRVKDRLRSIFEPRLANTLISDMEKDKKQYYDLTIKSSEN